MRDLQFRHDIGGSGESAAAFIACYERADGFSLVISARDDGDAEVRLTASDVALLQQRLATMLSRGQNA